MTYTKPRKDYYYAVLPQPHSNPLPVVPAMPKSRYHRLTKFVRDTIVDAGFATASGRPNVRAFYTRFKPVLDQAGAKISETWVRKTVAGADDSIPYGETLRALAILLSAARNENVTVAALHNLIDVPEIEDAPYIDPEDLPTAEEGLTVQADLILKQIKQLPISARQEIAPPLLRLLARDWEYLDAGPEHQLGVLLRHEVNRRGIGLERFAKTVLEGRIPVKALRSIWDGQKPDDDLDLDQILVIQEHIRSIDGDQLNPDELGYLAPGLDLRLGEP